MSGHDIHVPNCKCDQIKIDKLKLANKADIPADVLDNEILVYVKTRSSFFMMLVPSNKTLIGLQPRLIDLFGGGGNIPLAIVLDGAHCFPSTGDLHDGITIYVDV